MESFFCRKFGSPKVLPLNNKNKQIYFVLYSLNRTFAPKFTKFIIFTTNKIKKGMKKNILSLMSVLFFALAAFTFTSCGDDDDKNGGTPSTDNQISGSISCSLTDEGAT